MIASNVAQPNYVDYGWDALPIGQYKYGISTDGGNTISWSECLEKDVMAVDENDAMEIKVYPNPTNGILFVETRRAHRLYQRNRIHHHQRDRPNAAFRPHHR